MVVFSAVWLPVADTTPPASYLPTVLINHPYSGKRIKIKLLHWSGVTDLQASGYENNPNNEPFPIRIDFLNHTFQGSAAGIYQQDAGSSIYTDQSNWLVHVYPNAFVVPCLAAYNTTDSNAARVMGSTVNYKAPVIEGYAVGNLFQIQLNVVTSPQGVIPTDSAGQPYALNYLNGHWDASFRYYLAVFDIEEIK